MCSGSSFHFEKVLAWVCALIANTSRVICGFSTSEREKGSTLARKTAKRFFARLCCFAFRHSEHQSYILECHIHVLRVLDASCGTVPSVLSGSILFDDM